MKLLALALVIAIIAPFSWALSQSRVKPFQQYIDHFAFTQLSSAEQKAFLLSIMETMAEMEQEVIDADKIFTNDHLKKMQLREKKRALNQLKQIFEEFSQNLRVPSAYANETQYCSASAVQSLANKHMKNNAGEFVTCMYGTYMSNMIQDGNGKYCVRPACSGNPEFRDAHNNAARAARCSPAQMVCNPSIYGKDTRSNKASCVTLDFQGLLPGSFENIAHNVSLACLMEVTNDPNSDGRLEAIAQSIINPSTESKESAANNFNRMLSIITNVCLCGDVGFDGKNLNYYERTFDASYVQYLNGHRSCNALLNQMQILTGKIAATENYCTQNSFLPPNLSNLSSTLSSFADFSNRVNTYMRSTARNTNWSASNPSDRSKAMKLLKERWIVSDATGLSGSRQVVAADQALDNIFSQSQLAGWKQRICPLRIDPPREEVTCTISIGSQSRTNATTLAISATARISQGQNNDVNATLEWKLGDVVIPEQTAKSLTSNLTVAAEETSFALSATATVNGASVPCPAVSFDSQVPVTPTTPTCNLSSNTGTFTFADGKATLSTPPTHTITPADSVNGTLVWYKGDAEVELGNLTATAEETSIVLTAKLKPQTGNPISCGTVTFAKETPAAPTCRLSSGTGTFTFADGKATLSAPPTHTITPTGAVDGTLAWYKGDAEVQLGNLAATAEENSIVLTAKLKPQTGDQIECGSVTFTKTTSGDEDDDLAIASCKVIINPQRAQSGQSQAQQPSAPPYPVSARLEFKDASGDIAADNGLDAPVVWKLNGTTVSGQDGQSFTGSSPNPSFSVSASIGTMQCEAANVEADEPEKEEEDEAEVTSCSVSLTQSPAGTPGLFTVEASVAPKPDDNESVTFSGISGMALVDGKKDVARANVAGIAQASKKTVKAKYKAGGKELECSSDVEIPASVAPAPAGNGQQPFIPPSEGGFLIQKRGVN